MAGTAGSTPWHEPFLVGVAACTCSVRKMAVVASIIICVVVRFRMAGLADSVPWLIFIIKGKVSWPLLKNRKVKSTLNVPRCAPYEAQVSGFYIRVWVCGCFRTVGIVTGPAINDSGTAVHQVVAHIAHG